MQKPKFLTKERPVATIVRSNSYDDYLKDTHCPGCGKILFQSYSGTHMIIPGDPDTKADPKLINDSTIVLECRSFITLYKDGERINTRCGMRFFIT